MAQTLAEVLYDLGRAALAQQERQVAELRARTQALLAAAALVGSLFGVTAIDRAGLNAPAATALMLLAVSVFAGVYVLLPHRMHFVVDVYDVHRLHDRHCAAGAASGALGLGNGGRLMTMADEPSTPPPGTVEPLPITVGISENGGSSSDSHGERGLLAWVRRLVAQARRRS